MLTDTNSKHQHIILVDESLPKAKHSLHPTLAALTPWNCSWSMNRMRDAFEIKSRCSYGNKQQQQKHLVSNRDNKTPRAQRFVDGFNRFDFNRIQWKTPNRIASRSELSTLKPINDETLTNLPKGRWRKRLVPRAQGRNTKMVDGVWSKVTPFISKSLISKPVVILLFIVCFQILIHDQMRIPYPVDLK